MNEFSELEMINRMYEENIDDDRHFDETLINKMRRNMKTSDFKKGDKVKYIPTHANGDRKHKDCENGVVSSTNNKFVFVKYDNAMCIMTTGDEPYTSQATKPEDLIKF